MSAVTTERLSDEIGLLRVAMFPGAIGIDVAKDIDRGIAALEGCSRLIVDLRGNTGGGIGGLRLMSYLTPGKLEVGCLALLQNRDDLLFAMSCPFHCRSPFLGWEKLTFYPAQFLGATSWLDIHIDICVASSSYLLL